MKLWGGRFTKKTDYRIGTVAKKMHTDRSRNDQVSLDLRLYVMEEIETIKTMLYELLEGLVAIAKDHPLTIMPQKKNPDIAELVHYCIEKNISASILYLSKISMRQLTL